MVEAAVDARIVRYQEALRTHPDRAGLMSIAGALVYGGAEDPRAKQIARGMEYYRSERQHQRDIQAAIRKLREAQPVPRKCHCTSTSHRLPPTY